MNQEQIQTLASQCLSVRLRLLNRMVNAIFDQALRPHQVKASQMNVLVAVAHYRETTCREICQLLQMDPSTFSRTLTRLRKNGWLQSEPSGDGKILSVKITAEGQTKIRSVFPAWQQAQREATELLGKQAAAAIREAGSRQLGTGHSPRSPLPLSIQKQNRTSSEP